MLRTQFIVSHHQLHSCFTITAIIFLWHSIFFGLTLFLCIHSEHLVSWNSHDSFIRWMTSNALMCTWYRCPVLNKFFQFFFFFFVIFFSCDSLLILIRFFFQFIKRLTLYYSHWTISNENEEVKQLKKCSLIFLKQLCGDVIDLYCQRIFIPL